MQSSPDERLADALAEYERGRLAEAEALCRGVLREDPEQPDALHLLGRLALEAGDLGLAQVLVGRAIGRMPNVAAYHRTLGQAFRQSGQLEAALGCFEQVLALEPPNAEAYCRAGEAYQELGELDEAAAYFEQAATLDPRSAQAYLAWTLVLQQQGRLEDAVGVLRRGLAAQPDEPELAFLLAALGGQARPPRAPDAFLVQHFDRLAPRFDEHLRDRLEYRAPELLVELLGPVRPVRIDGLDVLDGGCGTGLCGPLLRPLARRLVGVDLAPRMLEQAAARGVYDELWQGELTEVLAAEPARYDLIVAADVCIYFGDLGPLFAAAAGALRPGGLLAVSVERAEQDDFFLLPTARYAHGAEYVRRTAELVRLTEVATAECVLRLELGEPIAGWLGVFRK